MSDTTSQSNKTRIAVLGGGLGSLAAVYGLTGDPSWQDRYDITVYQIGWRLGGKGASGRNRRRNMRIEEHGLHVWMGFYQNAFQMMQSCYAERARLDDRDGSTNVLRNWDDAFKGHNFMVIEEQVGGEWKHWPTEFPTNPGVPGDGRALMTAWQFIVTAINLLRDRFEASPYAGLRHSHSDITGDRRHDLLSTLTAVVAGAEHVLARAAAEIEMGVLVSTGLFLEHASAAAERLADREPAHTQDDHRHIAWLLREFRGWLGQHLQADISNNDATRRLWTQMDLALTMVLGVLDDGVMFNGFESIDDWEFCDWLRRHGASELGVNNALNEALYEGAFAYLGGDQQQPNMAAGAVTQSFFRLYLGYKGSVIYKMQAGMGDVVFAPIYRVLKERGVRFEFFHKVQALRYDAATNAVSRIECERQVALDRPYEPILRVNDLDTWPNEPNYESIQHGGALADEIAAGRVDLESQGSPPWQGASPVILERGRDYDTIVLGIPIAVLKYICPEVIDAKPAWQDMVANVRTVRTQGVQLWFTPTLEQTGWPMPSPCLINYAQPCAAWLDASQVLCREVWPSGQVPGSLAYLCSTLPDDEPEQQENMRETFERQQAWRDRVKEQTRQWLTTAIGHVWPALAQPSTPDAVQWDVLSDPGGASGESRLDAQYFRANLDASERYALSVAGSTKSRLRTDQSSVTGLYLTGDWIANGFNVGCVESTVIAGLQCSRAISGSPATIVGDPFMRL